MLARTLALTGLVLVTPAAATAQYDEGHVALLAGLSEYDIGRRGRTAIYALRADVPVYPTILMEAGFAYARPGILTANHLYLPEAQVQLQGTWDRYSPYVGLGAGAAVEVPAGSFAGVDAQVSFAPSFSTGVRVALATGAGLRLEGRIHGIGADFAGTIGAVTGGISIAW